MCSVMQRQRQLSPRKVRMVFQFLLLLFSDGGMLAVLKEMMNFKLLADPLFLLIGISNAFAMIGFYTPFVYLPNMAIVTGVSVPDASFLVSVMLLFFSSEDASFFICRLLGSATLLDESSQAGSQTSPGSVSLIFLLIITLFSGELAGDDQHGDYSFGDHGFSSSPSSFLSSLLLKYLIFVIFL